jgi:hypothetical protein
MVSAVGGFVPVVQFLLDSSANANQLNFEG